MILETCSADLKQFPPSNFHQTQNNHDCVTNNQKKAYQHQRLLDLTTGLLIRWPPRPTSRFSRIPHYHNSSC